MARIMVVEDDKHTRQLLETIFQKAGYEVYAACDGAQALEMMDLVKVDMLVVDVMMPMMDGYELTRQLRAADLTMPILMLTAKQLPQDKREGFLAGTDDYLTKPFDDEELLLRVRALLRRAKVSVEHTVSLGNTTLDADSLSVTTCGECLTLPQKEFQVLFRLAQSPGRIFTRLQLMDEIWGMSTETTDATVNVHINRLRKRFEGNPDFEIVTVRGLGYKVVKNE